MGENPEVAGVSLEEFDTEGIHIIRDPGFVANTERGRIPAAYTSAHKAVDAMLHQAREKGLAVMVTAEAAGVPAKQFLDNQEGQGAG